MANISKITIPDGTTYDLRDSNLNGHTVNTDVPSNAVFTDTTYESKAGVQGGTELSLVTTGEKFTWDNAAAGAGTVTSITAGAGLTGGTIVTSGTIAHSNSVTAQTTEAVYPITIDSEGHISGYGSAITPLTPTSTIPAENLSGNIPVGIMQRSMVKASTTDLGGVIVGTNLSIDSSGVLSATDTTYTATSPIVITDTDISHATSGVTAGSYGQTAAQTPTWGGTFSVPSATVDAKGHVTAMAAHNVTIPSNTATTTKNGLMASTDRTRLNALGNVSNLTYTVVSTW